MPRLVRRIDSGAAPSDPGGARRRDHQIRALIAELTEQMTHPAPPVLRQEQERALESAEMILMALEADEEEADTIREDIRERMKRVPSPRALKSVEALDSAMPYVHILRDTEPWEVWIRWDVVPPKAADRVISFASLWRDMIRNRPIGAPRGTRTKKPPAE